MAGQSGGKYLAIYETDGDPLDAVTEFSRRHRPRLKAAGRLSEIIDMNREWVVRQAWLQSRHKHSPFIGRTMKGWIDLVLRRGQTVAQGGEVTVGGGGVWLRSKRG